MNITIINDCRDDNAKGRQITRAQALIGGSVSFIGVSSDLEAAGNLIDVLDAYGDHEGVVLVNVAPRNGSAKKWKNGTPFCHFTYKNVLVVATVDGLTLSLVKKLALVEEVAHMDIPTVIETMVGDGTLTPETGAHIVGTQFRSYDFAPRVAAYLLAGSPVPADAQPMSDFPDAPHAVWWIDNFGNCKTTLLGRELGGATELTTPFGTLPVVEHLKDVDDGDRAVIVGSSGLGSERFLEIVVQGLPASQHFGLVSGSIVRA